MLLIVNNGKGAEEISKMVKVNHQILKPDRIGDLKKVSAFILSNGLLDKSTQKANMKLIEKYQRPFLGVGLGCSYIGAFFGAKIKEEKNVQRQERITITKPCPLLLDMKKFFTVIKDCKYVLSELPDNFNSVAGSQKCEYEIIQDKQRPLFGVHFNPELGFDGRKIIDNFLKFAEFWERYHK